MASGPRFYLPFPYLYKVGDNGFVTPINGARLNFYLTESNTRAPTYSNETLTVENTNPVSSYPTGLFPPIFLDPSISYKVVADDGQDGVEHQLWTADPVLESWNNANVTYWDQPFTFGGGSPPLASELIAAYTARRAQRVYGNFDGTAEGLAKAGGRIIGDPPADADYVVTAAVDGITVGTMTIAQTTGVFTFATTAGAAFDIDVGAVLTFTGAVTPDSQLNDFTFTITGVNL